MSAPHASAKSIFLQALELRTVTEREAYLDTQCGSDADLRCEVEELLRHQQSVEGFLESPPTAVVESAEQLRTLAPPTPSLAFLDPPSRADSLGRLGHYEILEVVGSGGMGIVLKAFDERLHRIVAIKAMNPALASSGTGRQRFVREAQAAAAVNHDNVVVIYAVEEGGPIPYLVMEYIAGISLDDKLKQQGCLPLKEILRIGLQVADGLAAAHRQGLVHRDIKPANILLENGVERVKITDFGLARAADDVSVTQTGIIAGTPAYMSPEQARGEAVDHRSDLFSLGSVPYALCTGQAPFRSSTSLGMLKRVCEEEPHPLRDLNPDIPEWLCAVVEKLHAKQPAERFQSAAELAEALGSFLAHVQQSSLPLPTAFVPASVTLKRGSRRTGRRLAKTAVAALILVGLTLSLTDASGLTQVAATVIRIFIPDGTLVVETNDPGVTVTVEGDGGLAITGTGLQAIRLRPGSYKVHASKDGQPVPLEKELVSIARGGREVVKVKLEGPPAPAVAKPESGAFVLLGGKGVAERKFDTLADAVLSSSDGDTIEIRGNGPFVSEPITIRIPLTIRAAPGFRPIIRLNPEHETGGYLIYALAPLVLEGLELQREARGDTSGKPWRVIIGAVNARLYAANCRFLSIGLEACLNSHSSIYELRNCELLCPRSGGLRGSCAAGQHWAVENCVQLGGGYGFNPVPTELQDFSIRLARTTIVASSCALTLNLSPEFPAQPIGRLQPPFRVLASGNVFDARGENLNFDQSRAVPLSPAEAEQALRQWLAWQGSNNVYATDRAFLSTSIRWKTLQPSASVNSLADWTQYWGGAETGSVAGNIRFLGGDLLARAVTRPDKISPEDFRLRPDSAGYRAGPNGKDLGADVDLVGPGPAYERWKQTPKYQEWLKETGQ